MNLKRQSYLTPIKQQEEIDLEQSSEFLKTCSIIFKTIGAAVGMLGGVKIALIMNKNTKICHLFTQYVVEEMYREPNCMLNCLERVPDLFNCSSIVIVLSGIAGGTITYLFAKSIVEKCYFETEDMCE